MIGRTIGQFRIKRQIGQGGMGAVYYAEHLVLQTPRAIKILLPQWSQNEMMARRFLNEARAAARIKHRNVLEVHDCGQLDDGTLYIVMDYLEGETLSECCRGYGGPIPADEVLRLLAPVALGLEAAHAVGIVHRDLKPDNVLLVRRDESARHPVIVDFGISKLGDHEEGAVTRTGMIAGTPIYMSPEQMRDLKLVDWRTDAYALGLIAYQMLTGGWLPYQAANEFYAQYTELSVAEIYHRQMSRPPIDPRQRGTSIDNRCAMSILAAIDLDPARRPTPRAFMLQLAEVVTDGFNVLREHANELLGSDRLLVRSSQPRGMSPTANRISRYEIGPRLGAGGMAEVFRATALGAEGFARAVALKRVVQHYSTRPQFASMFIQEAQLAAQLSHANIVSILDFDRDADGRLFLVMEWVDGVDLKRLVETGLLPFSTVIFVIIEVLRGLGYAHELPLGGRLRGVIHRDVSPHNVLLSWDGSVKVSDFGIAKARTADMATATDGLKGKPAYMSPEQANAEPLDGRSDLFAVGVVAWELLTGRHLFDAPATLAILAQVFFKDLERPSQVRPGVPRDVEAIVMRLLERDRAKRYATADAAIEDLARCIDAPRNGRSELARIMSERFNRSLLQPSQSQHPGQPTTMESAVGQSSLRRRRRKRAVVAAASVAAVGSFVLLASTLRDPSSARDAGAPPPVATTAPPIAMSAAPPAPRREVATTVVTNPIGAEIIVDGVRRGTAPFALSGAPGAQFTIEARLAGYQAVSTTITVASESQRIHLNLSPIVSAPLDEAASSSAKPLAGATEQKPAKKRKPRQGSAAADQEKFDPNYVGGER